MIYRDDDLPQNVQIPYLNQIHQMFLKRDKIHTITILASELYLTPEFIDYVNNHDNFDIALHGWTHIEYSLLPDHEVRSHLAMSMEAMEKAFKQKPTKWYLPWNGWVKSLGAAKIDNLIPIAKEFGLEIDIDCIHMGAYINGKAPDQKTVYFHWWNKEDINNLERLLDHEK